MKAQHEDALIDRRRQRVAQLIAEQFSQREVCDRLATEGFANPDTGAPYALGTINADVKVLRTQWRRDAARTIAEHRAEMLAELTAVKRTAWKNGDLTTVLKALSQQADILGLADAVEAPAETRFVFAIERVESRAAPPDLLPSVN